MSRVACRVSRVTEQALGGIPVADSEKDDLIASYRSILISAVGLFPAMWRLFFYWISPRLHLFNTNTERWHQLQNKLLGMTYWKRNQNVSRHLAACQLPQLEQVWKFSVSRDLQGLNCQIMQMLLIDICGISLIYYRLEAGPRFDINMSSCRYRKSHCGDKTVVRSSYLHNGISYIGKVSS